MKLRTISSVLVLVVSIVLLGGCAEDQVKSLKDQNRSQQERILSLESDLNANKLQLDQCTGKLDAISAQSSSELGLRDDMMVALKKDLEEKKDLIAKMQKQLLKGGAALPLELSVMLQDFANSSDMVTFDEQSGMLKFKSDFLFASGSDKVTAEAITPIKQLCKILNSDEGKDLDVVVIGHTDNVPISASRQDHPSNWHLSVHRAISVLNEMVNQRVSPGRISVKGFGEFRPVVENKPGKGAAENRRVEIILVPKGSY